MPNCETDGHVFGLRGICVMCKTPKPPEPLDDDMIEISQMLAAARAHNLETEVVWSFGKDRAGGSTVKDAVEFALSEWDL